MSTQLPEQLANDLDAKCHAIGSLLAGVEATRQAALLAKIVERIVEYSGQVQRAAQQGVVDVIPPSPEVLKWARWLFTEEEALAGLHEIRQTGGLKFAEVIRGLEPPASDG